MSKTEPFDFEKYIAAAKDKPRVRRVMVKSVDHSAEIDQLQEDLAEALADEQIAVDRRLSDKPKSARIYARIKKLQAEMDASAQAFVFRALTRPEWRSLTSALGEDEPSEDSIPQQLAVQSVDPKLTVEQWQQVAETLPVGEFGKLVAGANQVAMEGVETPKVSPTILEALQQRTSEQN